uniref:Ig-like domain-containing protein n=1 Tax=Labrus bergylta TaxID=56723 RepID=A0A3Q3ELS0_9LABR
MFRLMVSISTLFTGSAAGDKIYPAVNEVSGTEGESVTLRCNYETTTEYVYLYWYRHHSDLQAPQFILRKGARINSYSEYIPDKRYESQTSRSSTELTIRKLTPEDTALYYYYATKPDSLYTLKPTKITSNNTKMPSPTPDPPTTPISLFSTINKLLNPLDNGSQSFTADKCTSFLSFFQTKIDTIYNNLAFTCPAFFPFPPQP